MVRRGLAASRSEATTTIRAGNVSVGGRPAVKSGTLVLPEEPITVAAAAGRFVSRGGDKLEAALDRFGLDVAGKGALDAGAATGGFTDCLLTRGAEHVIAVDVGYGQLDWRLRQDPRVFVLERTNVRHLEAADLPFRPEVVTADLSFISLRVALPSLTRCAAPGAEFVMLVKPQFEADRDAVASGGGVVDPAVWRRGLESVSLAGQALGLLMRRAMASPLLGPAGNAEFLIHATAGDAADAAVDRLGGGSVDIDSVVREALALTGARARG
jgi:23S rRNA (cytidine1920-2'-O)/16S rRNA (cytidine1409-2'-O)-methyltransferase